MKSKHIVVAALAVLFGAAPLTSSASILYVATTTNSGGQIQRYSSGGALSIFGTTIGQPTGVAFDGSGNLFAADLITNTIIKFTPSGVKSTFASLGLNEPTGLAFDGAGNLYVGIYQTKSIMKFTITGVGSLFATSLGYPTNLAFDAAGNLYATSIALNDEDGGGAIEKFTPGGAGSIFASGLDGVRGLAFDPSGDLFASNGNYYGSADSTILKFTSGGEKSVFADLGLSFPQGLAFDTTGDLYLANQGQGAGTNIIQKFTPEGVGSTFVTLQDTHLPRYLAFTDDAGQRLLIPPAVPEPSSAALVGLGALLLARRRRA